LAFFAFLLTPKTPPRLATSRSAQVVAYAQAVGVTDAILIYPHTGTGWGARVGRTQVRTLTFDVGRDLDDAGKAFAALTRCA
jgi:hypothetical protein